MMTHLTYKNRLCSHLPKWLKNTLAFFYTIQTGSLEPLYWTNHFRYTFLWCSCW